MLRLSLFWRASKQEVFQALLEAIRDTRPKSLHADPPSRIGFRPAEGWPGWWPGGQVSVRLWRQGGGTRVDVTSLSGLAPLLPRHMDFIGRAASALGQIPQVRLSAGGLATAADWASGVAVSLLVMAVWGALAALELAMGGRLWRGSIVGFMTLWLPIIVLLSVSWAASHSDPEPKLFGRIPRWANTGPANPPAPRTPGLPEAVWDFCPSCGRRLKGCLRCQGCGLLILGESFQASADLARRVAAHLLDWLLMAVTLVVGWLVLLGLSAQESTSPGKRLLGLRVVDAMGEPLGGGRVWFRELVLKVVLQVLYIPWMAMPIVFLWAIWDRDRQALHDKALDTVVVVARPDERLTARFCPSCGSIRIAGAAFCNVCGRELLPSSKLPT